MARRPSRSIPIVATFINACTHAALADERVLRLSWLNANEAFALPFESIVDEVRADIFNLFNESAAEAIVTQDFETTLRAGPSFR